MARPRKNPESSPGLRAFSRRLKAWRIRLGYTQEALAEKAGLDKSHLSELERGVTTPSLETVLRLADGLGVNGSIFFLSVAQVEKANKILGLVPNLLPAENEFSENDRLT